MEQNTERKLNGWERLGFKMTRATEDDPIFNEPVRFSTMRRTRSDESSPSDTGDSTGTPVSKTDQEVHHE